MQTLSNSRTLQTGVAGVKHVTDRNFTEVIGKAMKMSGFTARWGSSLQRRLLGISAAVEPYDLNPWLRTH